MKNINLFCQYETKFNSEQNQPFCLFPFWIFPYKYLYNGIWNQNNIINYNQIKYLIMLTFIGTEKYCEKQKEMHYSILLPTPLLSASEAKHKLIKYGQMVLQMEPYMLSKLWH